jgi:hypothetical protein
MNDAVDVHKCVCFINEAVDAHITDNVLVDFVPQPTDIQGLNTISKVSFDPVCILTGCNHNLVFFGANTHKCKLILA